MECMLLAKNKTKLSNQAQKQTKQYENEKKITAEDKTKDEYTSREGGHGHYGNEYLLAWHSPRDTSRWQCLRRVTL